MGKASVRFSVVLFCSVLLIGVTAWSSILDQSQTFSNGSVAFWSDKAIIQTFTPSMTGRLETLSLPLGSSGNAGAAGLIEPIHILVTGWNGSSPQAVLGQVDATLTVDGASGWMDFDFLPQNVMLAANTSYAIMLTNDLFYNALPTPYRNTGIDVQWSTNPYARGGLWSFDGSNWIPWPYGDANTDAAFETWMAAVPEPASVLLFGIGAALLGVKKLRRK